MRLFHCKIHNSNYPNPNREPQGSCRSEENSKCPAPLSVDVHEWETEHAGCKDGVITPRELMYLRKEKQAAARALELRRAIGDTAEEKAIAQERKSKMWNGHLGSAVPTNAAVGFT